MKKIFLLCLGFVAFLVSVDAINFMEASAEAFDGQAEVKIVNKEANVEAIDIAKSLGALENSPVPVENLTTEPPVGEILYEIRPQLRAAKPYKEYVYQEMRHNGFQNELRCDYLVPVGFNWVENGIPYLSITPTSSFTFRFTPYYSDSGTGGYGTGGYYWRLFNMKYPVKKGYNTQWLSNSVWLSAWNGIHLLYGG
ncbi:hypothetical protein [Enterococcus sp. DIV1420a]|uniref:hypothetical protein n=1 Tax=Enterococcus sp. DIV1420a TaxID=2774672 RepID=UPI003F26A986